MASAYHNDQAARQAIAETASKLLADTYTLYLKTHGFHWNVVGPRFHDLHALFETQYTELWAAVDEIAERIRALGAKAPGSGAQFRKLAQIEEASGAPAENEMLRILLADHRTAARAARSLIEAAQEHGDEGTADLAIQRLRAHEKAAWMLDSLLQQA